MSEMTLGKLIKTCAYYYHVGFKTNNAFEPHLLSPGLVEKAAAQMSAMEKKHARNEDIALTSYTKASNKVEAMAHLREELSNVTGASPYVSLAAYIREIEAPLRAPLLVGFPWSAGSLCCADELLRYVDLNGATSFEDKRVLFDKLVQVFKKIPDIVNLLKPYRKTNDVRGAFLVLTRELETTHQHRRAYDDALAIYMSFWNTDALLITWATKFKTAIVDMDNAVAHLSDKVSLPDDGHKKRFLESLKSCKASEFISMVAQLKSSLFHVTTLDRMIEVLSELDPNKEKKETSSPKGAICSYTAAPPGEDEPAAGSRQGGSGSGKGTAAPVPGYRYPKEFRQNYLTEKERNFLDTHMRNKKLAPKDMKTYLVSDEAKAWVRSKGGGHFIDNFDKTKRGRQGDRRRHQDSEHRDGSPNKKAKAKIASLKQQLKKYEDFSGELVTRVEKQDEQFKNLCASLKAGDKSDKSDKHVGFVANLTGGSDGDQSLREKLKALSVKKNKSG